MMSEGGQLPQLGGGANFSNHKTSFGLHTNEIVAALIRQLSEVRHNQGGDGRIKRGN